MNSVETKLAASFAVTIMVFAGIMVFDKTSSAQDGREGLVIDFGYWNVKWTDISFTDEMNGFDALEAACHKNGYSTSYSDAENTILHSIFDGEMDQTSLIGMKWGFYIMREGGSEWEPADPGSVCVKDHRLVCWARAAGADSVIPGTDASGFTYYGYGNSGRSLSTGEALRVVSLAPSISETIVAVGGLDNIVGSDSYSNYPERLKEKKDNGSIQIVGGYTDPNYEWILKLAPDIVFCDGGVGEHVTTANKLRKSGLDCVVVYNGEDMATMYDNIWIVASALGMSDNAKRTINNIIETTDAINGVLGYQKPLRTFVALSALPSPWTSGNGTFMNDILTSIHAKNIFADQQSSWFSVAKELIHFKQPEIIIIILDGRGIGTQEEYYNVYGSLDSLWKDTPAYINGNVFIFSGNSADALSRPGPRLGQAVELIAKCLFPNEFLGDDSNFSIPKYFGDDYEKYITYQREVFP